MTSPFFADRPLDEGSGYLGRERMASDSARAGKGVQAEGATKADDRDAQADDRDAQADDRDAQADDRDAQGDDRDAKADDEDTRVAFRSLPRYLVHPESEQSVADLTPSDHSSDRVLRAFDTRLGREVELRELVVSERGALLRETEVLTLLDHPTVPSVFEFRAGPDGRLYAAVRLVQGKTLASSIREHDSISGRLTLLDHFRAALEGVAHAHARGVVHRNLKSESIMLGPHGETTVMDWGFALVRREREAIWKAYAGSSGPPREILPNSVEGEGSAVDRRALFAALAATESGRSLRAERPVDEGPDEGLDERSDVFALGAILFEILCGRSPHHEAGPRHGIGRAGRGRVRSVLQISREAPPELARICDRALAAEPPDGYEHAGRMLDDVRAFVEKRSSEARRLGPLSRVKSSIVRHRVLSPFFVIVFVLAAGAAWMQAGRIQEDLDRAALDRDHANRTLSIMLADRAEETASPHQAMMYAGASLLYADQPEARGTLARLALEPRPQMIWRSRPGAKCRSLAFTDNGRLSCADELDSWFQWGLEDGVERLGELRNSDAIVKEVVSRDGFWRATADKSGTIRVTSFEDGQARTFNGQGEEVVALDVRTDSTGSAVVAALSRPGTLRILSENGVPDGETMPACADARSIALARSGERVGIACPSGIEVRSTSIGLAEKIVTIPISDPSVLALSEDGRLIVAGNERGEIIAARTDKEPVSHPLIQMPAAITAIGLSKDGQWFVAGAQDGVLATGSTDERGVVRRISGHRGQVWAVALSPRADLLASSGRDGTVRLFKTIDGSKERGIVSDSRWLYDIAFTPDGRHVATCNTDGVWSTRASDTGQLELRVPSDPDRSFGELIRLAVSPDGRVLATGDASGRIHRWDLSTGKLLEGWTAHERAVWSLEYTARGQILSGSASGEVALFSHGRSEILVSGEERRSAVVEASIGGGLLVYTDGDGVRLEDLDAAASFSLQLRGDPVTALALAPDDRLLAVAEGKRITLWDLGSRKPIRVLAGHTDLVHDVEWSRNGEYLASASHDGTAAIWRARDGHLLSTIDHGDHVRAVAFSPAGDRLGTVGWDRSVRVFDVTLGSAPLFHGHTQPVKTIAFSDDGTTLVTAGRDGTIRRWDTIGHNELARAQVDNEQILALSRDGLRFLAADRNGVAYLWDLERGSKRTMLSGQEQAISGAAFSPSGALMATLGQKGELLVWSVSDRTLTRLDRSLRTGRAIAISSNGMLAAADMLKARVEVWNVTTQTFEHGFTGHANWVSAVALSPDGRSVASAGYDGTVRVSSTRTGESETVLFTPQKAITQLVFSPDGRQIAAGGTDGTLRIFDLGSGHEIATLRGYSGGQPAFSPDGALLAAATDSNAIRLFDLSMLSRDPQSILERAGKESGLKLDGARLSPDDSLGRTRLE